MEFHAIAWWIAANHGGRPHGPESFDDLLVYYRSPYRARYDMIFPQLRR